MRAGDESVERLRAAIEEIAAIDVPELLAEARAEARSRVRSMLAEAMAQTMLERAREGLEAEGRRPLNRPHQDPVPARAPDPIVTEPAETPSHNQEQFGWYVYGVARAGEPELDGVQGIDLGHGVTTLESGELAAIVSEVPLAEFDDERLREHLADMDWLERTARRHEEVLDILRDQRTVVPMRLCSIYRDESGIRDMLAREAAALEDALERLRGKAEWGVKVFAVANPLETETGPEDLPSGSDAAAGAAYMEQRRHEQRVAREAGRRQDELCSVIHERLTSVSVQSLVVALQRPEVTDHPGEMVLNGVYLVQEGEQERFHAEVAALRDEHAKLGLELERSGPWPAYNFVAGTIGAPW